MFKTLASFALAATLAGTATAAELEVRLANVAHERGSIRICLYNGPEGFRHEEKSLQVLEHAATPGTITARFENLTAGRYAIIAYHDENGDGTLNRFLGMVPTEGYGLSNNPEVMGPPAFEQAAFDVPDEGTATRIELKY
jgi:uncharacterized protein (DUF2141 family)